jgi:hypothetical protein
LKVKNYVKGENLMKDDNEVKFAWKAWRLISLLNDLIWEYYEDDFLDLQNHAHLVYRGSLDDHMGHDDPEF